MRRMVETMFRLYGQPVSLIRGGQVTEVKAFFRPDRDETGKQYSPLGQIPVCCRTYLGPVSPELQPGDQLRCGDQVYLVQQAEIITGIQGPVYCWARCREKGREEVWPKKN